jgi:acyl-CoA thioesterase II
MGRLDDDTAVAPVGDGRYEAVLTEDWNIWGPNGGYLAAVALRAAGAHSSLDRPRPASLQCHFLGVAAFAPVQLDVTVLRGARRAEALRVSMSQEGQPVLEALVWTVGEGLDGMDHVGASMPDVPVWSECPPLADMLPPDYKRHRFADNVEERWLEPFVPFDVRPASEPEFLVWVRLRPEPAFDDPFVDGGRLAVLVDTFQWPAAARGHDGATLDYVAPSLDLTCQFHRPAPASEWLLVEARSPLAADGLVAGTSRVWDEAGRLVASGSQMMLCRPMRPTDRPK